MRASIGVRLPHALSQKRIAAQSHVPQNLVQNHARRSLANRFANQNLASLSARLLAIHAARQSVLREVIRQSAAFLQLM